MPWVAGNSGPDYWVHEKPRRSPVSVKKGTVLHLDENDYKFGSGDLVLRVDAILHERALPGGDWLYVRGTTIHPDGREGQTRQVLVRLALRDGRPSSGSPLR